MSDEKMPTPIPGEVPTDPLDALIKNWRSTISASQVVMGVYHFCADELESVHAAHDALVRADAVKAIPGDPLDALIAKWRDIADKHFEPVCTHDRDSTMALAGIEVAAQAVYRKCADALREDRADHDALVSRRARELACASMCEWCREGNVPKVEAEFCRPEMFWHRIHDNWLGCHASPIRHAALANPGSGNWPKEKK